VRATIGEFLLPVHLSDAELLQRFVTCRDESAFAALMTRHGPMVFGVCRRVLHHVQDTEDAVQATFLVLVRKAGGIGRGELLGNWLHGVAARVAARARLLAAQRQRREATDMERIGTATRETPPPGELPAIVDEVQRLPAKYRGPVVLCYLEGRTNEEAAAELRWPLGTVKGRLARAREMLRKRLARRGLVLSAATLTTALSHDLLGGTLPPAVFDASLKAAMSFATGDATNSGLVSREALALTRGVLQTMFVTKLQNLAALTLAVALLIGAACVLAYPTLAPETLKKTDAENIQGDWKVHSFIHDGREPGGAEGDRFKTATVKITADEITATVGGEDRVSTYTIDPKARPKTMDITHKRAGGGEELSRGLYKLEGDTLTFCANRKPGADRPTDFDSKEGSDIIVMVLKRVRK
jgi:RNA polymerase sigma factor (sigma-70 family)